MQRIVETGMKFDLHIHSAASFSKDGKKVKNNTVENIPVLVSKLDENGVNICSITDHDVFSYEMYSALKRAEKEACSIKKVLPGVEFSVRFFDQDAKEQVVHVVAIFNDADDSKVKNIEEILSANGPDENRSFTEEAFINVLKQIDLDTILIAHQKSSLFSGQVRKDDVKSLGEEKFLEFIYSDYFEALEFKNRKNEVLNKSYLSEKGLLEKVQLVTGSDCHDWAVYPREDRSDKHTNDFPYTYAKCLPSFRGLVMAMTDHSRLKRTNSFFCVDKVTLAKIQISQGKDQTIIPLSKGINVIIGDNSVGKSMLLHALTGYSKNGISLPSKIKAGYQTYIKDLGITLQKQINKDDIFCFDMQGEVRSKFETGNFDSSKFLSSHFPAPVDPTPYKALLLSEIDKMIQYLEKKFLLDDSIKKMGKFIIFVSDGAPESLVFEKNLRATKQKTDKLDKILSVIRELLITHESLIGLELDSEDREELENYKDFIIEIQKKYTERRKSIEDENTKIELVAKAVDVISSTHNRNISDNQKREALFSENTEVLKESLKNIIVATQEVGEYSPNIRHTSVDIRSNKVHDYEFISKLGIDCINTDYYLSCISSIVRQGFIIDWKSITEQELKKNLLRYDYEAPVLQFVKDALIEKIDNDLHPQRAIINQGLDKTKELSAGMNSKTYFDLLTYDTLRDGIYIIDQPEDNVSQKSIKNQLLDSFKYMGENRQVIMVTHNPQFIVNLDVDNVIYISKKDDRLQIQSGALEFECSDYKMLDIVANTIDGGLDTIKKRWKRYEKTVNL